MAIPLGKWYRLGTKTFWIFFWRGGGTFIICVALVLFLTYKMIWGSWHNGFGGFLDSHSNWGVSLTLFLTIIWILISFYFFIMLLSAWVVYRQYKFMLDDNALHVKRGIFMIKESVIPYHHIQNVEIKQPYLFLIFGLAELDITTLGNGGGDEQGIVKHKEKDNLLPAVDKRIAKILAEELVRRGSLQDKTNITDETEDGDNAFSFARKRFNM